MRRIRRIKRIALGLTLGAACALGLYEYHLRREGGWLVQVVYEFHSNSAKPPTIADLRQRFGDSLKQRSCNENGCGYEVPLTNQFLASLHLAPFTVLSANFWTTHGVLDASYLYFWTINADGMFLSQVTFKYCNECNSVWLNPANFVTDTSNGHDRNRLPCKRSKQADRACTRRRMSDEIVRMHKHCTDVPDNLGTNVGRIGSLPHSQPRRHCRGTGDAKSVPGCFAENPAL